MYTTHAKAVGNYERAVLRFLKLLINTFGIYILVVQPFRVLPPPTTLLSVYWPTIIPLTMYSGLTIIFIPFFSCSSKKERMGREREWERK